MSATGRNKKENKRNKLDHYITPSWCIERLLEAIDLSKYTEKWLEPAAGEGALINAVSNFGLFPKWYAIEIQDEFYEPLVKQNGKDNVLIKNYMDLTINDLNFIPQIIITNPPYSRAFEFIKKSMEFKPDYICMLTRLNFLASKDRSEFFHKHTPDVFVLPDRPSFTGNGSDATEYCWMIWRLANGYGAPGTVRCLEVLNTTPLSIRRPKKIKPVKKCVNNIDTEEKTLIQNISDGTFPAGISL